MTIRIPGDELNEEIARLNPSGASTWLVAVTLPGGEILRFCRSSSAVEFLGYSWTPFPFNEPSIRQDQNGELVTSGGRVLGVTATAEDLEAALKKAYSAAKEIGFDGSFMRNDIGQRALRALK